MSAARTAARIRFITLPINAAGSAAKNMRRQFSVKTCTVMEESPLSLDRWAVAMWLEVNAKNSISSYELHRALGITQKSAWFMLHRIRFALKQGSFETKIGGGGTIVEADETYIGGLAKNMHKTERARKITGTGVGGKTAVMGLLERHSEKGKSKVRTKVLETTRKHEVHGHISEHVEPGTFMFTDSLRSYVGLPSDYAHEFVNHAEQYVRGAVHTNGLENFLVTIQALHQGHSRFNRAVPSCRIRGFGSLPVQPSGFEGTENGSFR